MGSNIESSSQSFPWNICIFAKTKTRMQNIKNIQTSLCNFKSSQSCITVKIDTIMSTKSCKHLRRETITCSKQHITKVTRNTDRETNTNFFLSHDWMSAKLKSFYINSVLSQFILLWIITKSASFMEVLQDKTHSFYITLSFRHLYYLGIPFIYFI